MVEITKIAFTRISKHSKGSKGSARACKAQAAPISDFLAMGQAPAEAARHEHDANALFLFSFQLSPVSNYTA